MDINTSNIGLAQTIAQALSDVYQRNQQALCDLRKQGFKMVMLNNGYVFHNKKKLWFVDSPDRSYCDDDLAVGDKAALRRSGDFDNIVPIVITSVEQLLWCNRIEYGFEYLAPYP